MTGLVELRSPLSVFDRSCNFPGLTIQDHYDQLNLQNIPVVCIFNGEPTLRKDWKTIVYENDVIEFICLPQGGSFNKIIKAIAVIALAVFAPYAAGVIGGIIGLSSAAVGVLSAGLILGGTYLINALLPTNTAANQAASSKSVSPTYNASIQGNTARLLEPIPRLYGFHKIYPDFFSQPWSNFESNDQILYVPLCLGVGHYDLKQINIDDTKLWDSEDGFTDSFSDVSIEIVPPGGTMTLFPAAVITSTEVGGQDLFCVDQDRRVNMHDDLIEYVPYSGDEESDDPNPQDLSGITTGDELTISGSASNNGTYTVVETSGDGTWVRVDATLTTISLEVCKITTVSWVGPYVANPWTQKTNKLQFDFVCQRGLFYAADDGTLGDYSIYLICEARSIDATGSPTSGWTYLGAPNFTRATSTAQRFTVEFSVALGRYEVRARRASTRDPNGRVANDIVWSGLRAFILDDSVFPDVTLLNIKMKVNNQLTTEAARKFNTFQIAKVPIWNGSTWSAPTATRNLAWAATDILRNPVYGGGVSDAEIDLPAFRALALSSAAREDWFDGVFDTKTSVWEAVGNVLRVGRSQPIMVAGTITQVRDEAATLPRALLSASNILPNTVEIEYVMQDDDSPDAVIIEYMDNRTWTPSEILCALPGSTEDNPARIGLFGVTDRAHAWREGMYNAACNAYRRIFASLSTEMEGRMYIRGDSIALSHDLPQWGKAAIVLGWNAITRRLAISEPVSGNSRVALTGRRGEFWGPVLVDSYEDDGYTAVLNAASLSSIIGAQGAIPIYLDDSEAEDPTRAVFGNAANYVKKFKVVSTVPNGLESVAIVLNNDDPRVYTADAGSPPAELDPYGPGIIPNAPVITGIVVTQSPSSGSNPVTLNVSWNPASGAVSYLVESSTDGLSYHSVYNGSYPYCTFLEQAGPIYIRVSGMGSVRGGWYEPSPNPKSYGVPSLTPDQPDTLTSNLDLSAGILTAVWTPAARATRYVIKLYLDTDTEGVYDDLIYTTELAGTNLLLTSSQISYLGGPWEDYRLTVAGKNSNGTGTPKEVIVTSVTLAPPYSINLLTPYNGVDLNIQWSPVSAATSYELKVFDNIGSLVGTYVTTGVGYYFNNTAFLALGGPWRNFHVEVRSKRGFVFSSTSRSKVIRDDAPPVPGNILHSSAISGEIVVSWDAADDDDLTDYVLFHDTTTGFTPGPGNEVYRGPLLTKTLTGLTPASIHYFVLRAEDSYAGSDGFIDSTEFSQIVS